MSTKVVIQQRHLQGSAQSDLLQKIATVYVDGDEYRVYAPPNAVGDALEWVGHLRIHQPNPEGFNSEIVPDAAYRILATKLVKEELERMKRDTNRPVGLNPDGIHCDAQICLRGHIRSADGSSFEKSEHCTKCGALCIDECAHCKTPIRGPSQYSSVQHYEIPLFCHGSECGLAYPWMQAKLDTAQELLDTVENLSLEDREELWDLLKFVLSDPKSALTPAKTKLLDIKLAKKVGKASRDIVMDFTAKVTAELLKSKF
jgi:hypothetical protein